VAALAVYVARPPTPMNGKTLRIEDIEHFHWSLSEGDTPFSAIQAESLSLPAAIELACIEAAQRKRNLPSPDTRFGSCPIRKLIKATSWPTRRTSLSCVDGPIAAVVLPKVANGLSTKYLHVLLDELKRNGFPKTLAAGLAGAVAEMVDNVWQHSETQVPALLAYHVKRRKFSFSVADTGVGILASLRQNPQFRTLRSSMDAITRAIEPGVSRFDGGTGFTTLFHALAELWGNARIRSGEAALLIDRTSEHVNGRHCVYLPPLPGVHVAVRCRLDPPSDPSA
jgi:anti-sigma regulatory factor (Ser/Thr protein kinase)